MSITVEQFIAQSQNIEFKCVAGFGGLGREVSSFSIVDTPEILNWLKGGELVVEAGYISKNFPALRANLVRDLAEKGCAGLGVKLNRYYNKLPDEFIEQGDKYDFPIFELPYETRFCDVAFEIHKHIFESTMTTAEKIYNIYSRITRTVLSDASGERMLYDVCTAVRNPVLMLGAEFELLAYENSSGSGVDIQELMQLEYNKPFFSPDTIESLIHLYRKTRFKSHSVEMEFSGKQITTVVIPIQIGSELYGYIAIPQCVSRLSPEQYQVMDSITSIIAISFLKNSISSQSLRNGGNHFVNAVLEGDITSPEAMRRACEIYNFNTGCARVCITVSIKNFVSFSYEKRNSVREIINSFDNIIQSKFGAAFYPVPLNDRFSFFIFFPSDGNHSGAEKTCEEIAGEFSGKLSQYGVDFKIGISSCTSSEMMIPRSFHQAAELISMGSRIFPERNIYSYSKLQNYYIPASTMTKSELQNLVDDTILPLVLSDSQNGGDLVQTLECYINNRFNVTKTASELFVHRNTMINKLERINEILQIDMEDFENVIKIQSGIHALKILETNALLTASEK